MHSRDWLGAVAEIILWYFTIYFALYSVKYDVDLYQSAAIILIFSYAAMIACPWFRHTNAWKRMWGNKD